MLCKRCNHEDYTHSGSIGQCQAWIVKYQTPFVKTNYFGESVNAYASSIEYESQCPCTEYTNIRPAKRPRRKTLIEMSLDQYINTSKTMKQTHHGRPA